MDINDLRLEADDLLGKPDLIRQNLALKVMHIFGKQVTLASAMLALFVVTICKSGLLSSAMAPTLNWD